MREKRNFAERTKALISEEVRKKNFLVYEGKETELLYFDAVNTLKDNIKLNPLIELVPVIRSYSEEGWSNPKKIVDRITMNIQEIHDGNFSYETLLNWIMEYFQDTGIIAKNRTLARNIWNTLIWICKEKLNLSLNNTVDSLESRCKEIILHLKTESEYNNLVTDIDRIIKYGNFTFEKDIDKICFVVDRDKDSFVSEQYDYVVNKCQEKGYGLYLTNPNFEFWLLLHFDDVFDLDIEYLLNNPNVTSKRKYTEDELRKRMPGFNKSKYDALELVEKIDIAIENEKRFSEEIKELKNQVGSNIGKLIQEMRE